MSRKLWLLFLAVGVVSACSSRRAAPVEQLGTQASALFALGVPCGAAGQCTSGFCVDGVCCDTACGGGVRDLQACSTVYGPVNGLVNGTCKTLVPGDACGSLTSVSPCQWRGTTVNNGNNCPNPPSASQSCFPCADATQCGGAFPVCSGGGCVACDGNFGGGTPAACSAAAPACTTDGTCVQCSATVLSACAGMTPTCNTASDTCVACNGDNGSGATQACPTAGAPACSATGACVACTATNGTACAGATPACDPATNTCTTCNGDNGSGATAACPSTDNPYCAAGGTCGKCTADPDCAGHAAGPVCNLATGACGAACASDAQCAANQWCATNACVAKTANGEPLPAVAPINGTCTAANGTRVCLSGACDATDNRCGLPNGAACGPPPNNDVCRGGQCNPVDSLCGLPAGSACTTPQDCRSNICPPSQKCGTCQTDVDCGAATSGMICDETDLSCKPGCRGAGGNGCAVGQVCTSTTAVVGKCVQCVTDTTCGAATSGQVCNPATNTCMAGCRGADGNGCPVGQTCSSADGTIGACAAAPACATDVECGIATSGQVCGAGGTCQAGCRGTGGNTCPVGQTCSSQNATIGTCAVACATDAECGAATSGQVCGAGTCIAGCRGTGGNGCGAGQQCSSTTNVIGACTIADAGVPDGGPVDAGPTADAGPRPNAGPADAGPRPDASTPPADAGGNSSSGGTDAGGADAGRGDAGGSSGNPAVDEDGVLEGGGLSCGVSTGPASGVVWSTLLGLAIVGARRRRRDRHV